MKKIAILISLILTTSFMGCGTIKISFENKSDTESSSTKSETTDSEASSNTEAKTNESDNNSKNEEKQDTSSSNSSSGADLGDDLYNQKFELDGKQYSIGVSIEQLQKDGWTINRGAGQKIPGKGKLIGVELKKGNEKFSVIVYNQSPNESEVENGVVSQISVFDTDKVSSFGIAKGISIGSSKEDLEKALSSYKVSTSETDSWDVYETNKDYKYYVKMYVSKETKKVVNISISSSDL